MNPKYLAISLLRVAGLFAIFIGSWLAAYFIGQLAVQTSLLDCRDPADCELTVGIIVMPLGGIALYILSLVAWSFSAWKRPSGPLPGGKA